MTIVGVAARGFQGVSLGYRPNLHIPVTMKKVVTPSWDDLENRRSRWLQLFARLKPGVSREAAEASIQTLYKQIIQAEVKEAYFSNVPAHWRKRFLESHAVVMPGGQGYSGMRNTLEMPVKVLLVLVLLVLVVACANVSNLLAARATSRKRELSVRMALGAGRGRIVQQLLVESLILSTTGALLGLAVAYWTLRGLLLLAPTDQAQIALSPVPDLRILGFSLAAAVISAILFGLLPAIQTSRTDLFSSLKEQSNTDVGGPGRMRQMLVISQVALSLLLLIGSGLFVQSLRNLQRVDPGFEATNLVRFKLDPMLSGYDVERTKQFYQTLQQRLESLPGVQSTGLALVAILENNEWDSTIAVEGYQSKEGESMNPHFNAVSPGYFRTLGIPMLAGIDFNEQIGTLTRKAVVVNESFVKKYFGDRNPIGRHIGFGGGTDVTLDVEIVGVISN